MNKPTFKVNYPTGKYRNFDHPDVDIKVDGRVCGSISFRKNLADPTANGYKVSLQVKRPDGDGWEWCTFKAKFSEFSDRESIQKAKEWVLRYWDKLIEGRELHFFER